MCTFEKFLQRNTSSKVVFSSWFWGKIEIFHENCNKIIKMLPSQKDDTKLSISPLFVKINFKPVWERYKYLFEDLEAKAGFFMSTFKIHHFLQCFFYKKLIFLQGSVPNVLTNTFFEIAMICATFEFFGSCQSNQYSLS